MFYYTEGFDCSRPWVRDKAEEEIKRVPLSCTERDPYLLHKFWQRWVRKQFYTGVVFRFFDLGDLAFCPDYRAEQSWKNRLGKKGLLQDFRPQFVGGTWEGFWNSVEEQSTRYILRATDIVEKAAHALTEEKANLFQDALEYEWFPGFVGDFQAYLTQGLWESGVVQREDPRHLDSRHEVAAWRMLEREFNAQA